MQSIESEVRTALESVTAAEQRRNLAAQARELAQTLYEGEKRLLTARVSTVCFLLQRQTTLVQAQAAELQAQTDSNRVISHLRRTIGTSLDTGLRFFTNPSQR